MGVFTSDLWAGFFEYSSNYCIGYYILHLSVSGIGDSASSSLFSLQVPCCLREAWVVFGRRLRVPPRLLWTGMHCCAAWWEEDIDNRRRLAV